jgi:hypothetical protein
LVTHSSAMTTFAESEDRVREFLLARAAEHDASAARCRRLIELLCDGTPKRAGYGIYPAVLSGGSFILPTPLEIAERAVPICDTSV